MIRTIKIFIISSILILASCSSFVRYTSGGIPVNEPVTSKPKEMPKNFPPYYSEDFTGETFNGTASYYADKFHGKKTANGEIFDNEDFTGAHRTLPFGTKVLVINTENMKSVVVRINDRGPFVKNRLIDVSRAAADILGMLEKGTAEVEIRVLKK